MGSCLTADINCLKCGRTISVISFSDSNDLCDQCKADKKREQERLAALPNKYRKYKTVESSESLYWSFPTLENQPYDSIDVKQIINTSLDSFYESFNRTKKGLKDRLEVDGFVNDLVFTLKDNSYSSYEGEDLGVSITATAWRELNEKEKTKLEARLEKERKEKAEKQKRKAEKAQTEEYKHYLRLREKYEQQQEE